MIIGLLPVVEEEQKVKVQVLQIIMLVELLVEKHIMAVGVVLQVNVILVVIQLIMELREILV